MEVIITLLWKKKLLYMHKVIHQLDTKQKEFTALNSIKRQTTVSKSISKLLTK